MHNTEIHNKINRNQKSTTDPHSEVVTPISLLYTLFHSHQQAGNSSDMKKLFYSHSCNFFQLLSVEHQAPEVEVGMYSPQLRTHVVIELKIKRKSSSQFTAQTTKKTL